jgi:hypothetical protein
MNSLYRRLTYTGSDKSLTIKANHQSTLAMAEGQAWGPHLRLDKALDVKVSVSSWFRLNAVRSALQFVGKMHTAEVH